MGFLNKIVHKLSGGIVSPFFVCPCQMALLIVMTDHGPQAMHGTEPWRRTMLREAFIGSRKIGIQRSNFAGEEQGIFYPMFDLIEQRRSDKAPSRAFPEIFFGDQPHVDRLAQIPYP